MPPVLLKIDDFKSVSRAVRLTVEYCSNVGFPRLEANLVASAASEIATNVAKYAVGGRFEIDTLKNGRGVAIIIEDDGNGIESIETAMNDGFSTDPTSLGIGLGVAKRAMDYFQIQPKEKGLRIKMEKWLQLPSSVIDYAVISLPDPNYPYNGDGHVFKEFDGDSLFTAVIDGLGEGFNAWQTTQSLKSVIEDGYADELEEIMRKCDADIRTNYKDSGAAIGLLKVTPKYLSYLGVGDTFLRIYAEEDIQMVSKSGIVGAFALPTLQKKERVINGNTIAVLGTDGIHEDIVLTPELRQESSQLIAEYIFTNYRRAMGDASVIVIKINQEDD